MQDYPDIPLILDPILTSGAGPARGRRARGCVAVAAHSAGHARHAQHPGSDAARAGCRQHRLRRAGTAFDRCTFVLVTGTHEKTLEVVNRLYGNRRLLESFHWERLPHSYHGSGCTLRRPVRNLRARLRSDRGRGEAQDFTWHALLHANRLGMGQHLPDRLYWARDEDEDDDSPADEPLH